MFKNSSFARNLVSTLSGGIRRDRHTIGLVPIVLSMLSYFGLLISLGAPDMSLELFLPSDFDLMVSLDHEIKHFRRRTLDAGGLGAGAEILDADRIEMLNCGFLKFEPERVEDGAAKL